MANITKVGSFVKHKYRTKPATEEYWGVRKLELDNDIARKHIVSDYTADEAGALAIALNVDQCYVNKFNTFSGTAVTVSLPDVSIAKDRQYVLEYDVDDTTVFTVEMTGTSTADFTDAVDGTGKVVVFSSDGLNWTNDTA